jgi:hypothetical protein
MTVEPALGDKRPRAKAADVFAGRHHSHAKIAHGQASIVEMFFDGGAVLLEGGVDGFRIGFGPIEKPAAVFPALALGTQIYANQGVFLVHEELAVDRLVRR